MNRQDGWRIGIDLGGTKIEIAVLGSDGELYRRRRVQTPQDYPGILEAIAKLVANTAEAFPGRIPIGIGIPGVADATTGLIRGANLAALRGRPLAEDLTCILGRPVRLANDANCFALSEARSGAGIGARVVFGVILGTGIGGGIIVNGEVCEGRHAIGGEWGHTPLPWPAPDEYPGPSCWCGARGCLETWLAGPALAAQGLGPGASDPRALIARAAEGDWQAKQALSRHADRLARGLAVIVTILDPDAIVLGGGLSNMEHLYSAVPARLRQYCRLTEVTAPILRNRYGDSSGVRGAAWLWPPDNEAEGGGTSS